MRIYTNTDIIASRSKWAKRIAPVTMLLLVAGLITNFMSMTQPEYFQLTMILLALAFVAAIISSSLVNRWVREPRADQILNSTLKKFGNEFILFNYTTPVSHVLLTPSRLYSIVVKNQDGQVTVNGRRFSRKFTWGRFFRFFADEGLGIPSSEAEKDANNLSKFIRKNIPDVQIPEIKPVVVFSHKDVELLVNNSDVPVMRSNELKAYLRDNDRNKAISAVQRDSLIKFLGGSWPESKE